MATNLSQLTKSLNVQLLETEVVSEDIDRISNQISRDQYLLLCKDMKISEQKFHYFETYCRVKHLAEEEIVIQIIKEWEKKNGKAVTKDILKNALRSIGREDVADSVFSDSGNIQGKKRDIGSETERMDQQYNIEKGDKRNRMRQLIPEEKEENEEKEEKEMIRSNSDNMQGQKRDIGGRTERTEQQYNIGRRDKRNRMRQLIPEEKEEQEMNRLSSDNMQCKKRDIGSETERTDQQYNIGRGDKRNRVRQLIPELKEEKEEMKEKEMITSNENVTLEEMTSISQKICGRQQRTLARALNLSEPKIENIETNCRFRNLGDDEIVTQIILEWQRINGSAATKDILKKALLFIGQKDVADMVFPDLNQKSQVTTLQNKEILLKIEENQIKVYKAVQLPEVIWTKRNLPLEELYVNLELLKTGSENDNNGEPMQLEELFSQTNQNDPVRILIEGWPGYGKTTLCCKLLNDWGRNRLYLRSRFKMVFLFELRYFKDYDSFEEMLKNELENELGVNGDDGIKCIEAFQNDTLLILDGFDELDDDGKRKVLSLIRKEKFPSMFVAVTCRTGMFQGGRKKEKREGGILKTTRKEVNLKDLWNKRVIIKGVTADKVEIFMRKYFDEEFNDLELKIQCIMKREMKEVFECPLFLILLATMLEEKKLENVNLTTNLYKEFFNFLLRRYLLRENSTSDEKKVDIFSRSSDHWEMIRYLDQFGQLAVKWLCENKLMFEETEVSEYFNDKIIFHLGFLTKIPKLQGRRKDIFYQPIHKSFLEFLAAFAMWKLFKRDEKKFTREIERIGNKGLKPTNDSFFYVFLGGFMNSKAYVLFQSLSRYALWFNIESLCFTNILLEIQDIPNFFSSFQPILNSFIPPYYANDWNKWLTRDSFESEIHSLILKHSSDHNLINVLEWKSDVLFELSNVLHVECIHLRFKLNNLKTYLKQYNTFIRCENIICEFSEHFEKDEWKDFLSLFNSIQSKKIHFFFCSKSYEVNSLLLCLLHTELTEGQWKGINIDRLRIELNEYDDPGSLSLLVQLVNENRINEGVHLWIDESQRTEENNEVLKWETEELFNEIINSTTINEFSFVNFDSNFTPELNFSGVRNPHFKSFNFVGSLNVTNSTEKENEKYSVNELKVDLPDTETELNFIQNIQGIKYLECHLNCFLSLVEMDWPGLKEIEEIELHYGTNNFQYLNYISQLTNLQVFTFHDQFIETNSTNTMLSFITLFSTLKLRICQFLFIKSVKSFSFLTEVLMKGLEKHKKAKKIHLQELVIWFDEDIDFNELKKCNGIQCIQSMLRNKQLLQCCWVQNYYSDINFKSDAIVSMFPPSDKFRLCREVNGMNPQSSRWCQHEYRWFSLEDRFCIKFLDK